MEDKRQGSIWRLVPTRDRYVYLLLLTVSIMIRLPFLKTFDLVTFDGTYYINQARTILRIWDRPLTFPIGYPLFIALFIPLIRDGVRAAQAVSFLAGIGSLFVFYSLARRFVQRNHALLAALILALTPLFINLSMVTMSESLYLFWVLLGFHCFSREKDLAAGLSLGMAAITRVEALGILAMLAILRLRKRKSFVKIVAGFACMLCVNIAVQSFDRGALTVLPHLKSFGSSASSWKMREARIEYPGMEKDLEAMAEGGEGTTVLGHYLKRMPVELELLIRHVAPAVFLLALYGIYCTRIFLLAAFLPFFILPLFTTGSDYRFILPYIPMLILYSMIGVERVPSRTAYRPLIILLMGFSAAAFCINRNQLTIPISNGYQWAKEVGHSFKDRVISSDRIADRKPYFAFYSGGEYVEIPIGPYDETLDYLAKRGVRYLVLEAALIRVARPKLMPLLYDRSVINGEMRFLQVYFKPDVVSIFERDMGADPINRQCLAQSIDGRISGLSWSPDGSRIAYRLMEASGRSGIYAISTESKQSSLVVAGAIPEDQIGWSPDSRRFAFAMTTDGNTDIFVRDDSGDLERITSFSGVDKSPSWSKDGKELVFSSELSGRSEIWLKNLETGALKQVTANGGNSYPSLSPDGKYIAWIRDGEGLFIYERGTGVTRQAASPKQVHFTPAWSPDGKFIAVTALDWGKADIYMLPADGSDALLLTKSILPAAAPTWNPDGSALAAITIRDKRMEILVLTGIEPYKERLMNPIHINVFELARIQ